MVIFDFSNPRRPSEVGRYFAPGGMVTVLNGESLAYVPAHAHTHHTVLHVVDITDPANPVKVGSVGGWEGPSAMVMRDSFLYAAEPYHFEVFNVANPAQPVVIGSISSSASGIAVYDTFAYLAVNYGGLKVGSVADPRRPYPIDTLFSTRGYDVELTESLLLYGGLDLRVLELRNPGLPAEIGFYATPYRTRKVSCDSHYIYAACYLGGFCVLELLPSGLKEEGKMPKQEAPLVWFTPNPSRSVIRLTFGESGRLRLRILDAPGRQLVDKELQARSGRSECLDITLRPAGGYFLDAASRKTRSVIRLVKQ